MIKMTYKNDFPIFNKHKDLVYLDSAATSQRPKTVIDSLTNFLEKENANIHRGIYTLSEQAMLRYNETRETIAEFINASKEEIVFTKNTTESINLLASTIKSIIPEGKNEILLTEMEHHSNLVPWQQLSKRTNMKLKFIKLKEDFTLDLEDAKEKITDKTAILSTTHISNVLGTINPVKELINLAKQKNVLTIIDAAQSVAHKKIDVKDLDCDFLVFSSHKIFGPTGIGVLYGKSELLNKLPPYQFGGGMIKVVTYEDATFLKSPEKFEAGTQNIGEAIALGEAIKYIKETGIENIEKYEKELLAYTLEKLNTIKEIKIYNPGLDKSSSIISFNLGKIHPHDIAQVLNEHNIAIRAGHHCCMPLMNQLKTQGTARISLSIYNNKQDIDKLITALKKAQEIFK
tara:strand:+ start:610 stop:1815 length:1206 start_codon:yes stop_codon:yes gene_type:complete